MKSIINFEFKARTNDLTALENSLAALDPRFVGEDRQVDTYFAVPVGRLKLREGNIENALIYYERADIADAKESKILLYQTDPGSSLKEMLINSIGIKVVVEKIRRIYFIDNVKFHFDKLSSLGTFVEVEAIDSTGDKTCDELEAQCRKYADFFGIQESDFSSKSYSDMILDLNCKR